MHISPPKVILMHRTRFCELVCLVGCSSVPHLIHMSSCSKGGENSPHLGLESVFERGGWTPGGQKVRELIRNNLMAQVLVMGALFKSSHRSAGVLFLLCLWHFINPTSIRCTWSYIGLLTSQSYSSKFIHKETLRAELISSLTCWLNQLISLTIWWWFHF